MSVCMKGSVVMAFSLCFRPRRSIAPGESQPLAFSFISMAVSQNGTRTHTVPQKSLATILGCDVKGNNVRLNIITMIIQKFDVSKFLVSCAPCLHLFDQKYSKNKKKNVFCYIYIKKFFSSDGKTEFSATITQSSLSHDPSEIILIC